jgi:hypothetical protein
MRRSRPSAIGALLLAGVLFGDPASGQEWILPPLLPGGSDTAFDILKIKSGMGCAEALQLLQQQYPKRDAINKVIELASSRNARMSGASVSMDFRVFLARLIDSEHDEEVRVECSKKEALGQVFSISRRWTYNTSNLPRLDEVKAVLESKYGAFGSSFTKPDGPYAVFGTLFGAGGRLKGIDDSCGRFLLNTPEGAIAAVSAALDTSRCSYALYAALELAPGDKSRVHKMTVWIWDYLRFRKLAEFTAMLQEELRKKNGPKLPPM